MKRDSLLIGTGVILGVLAGILGADRYQRYQYKLAVEKLMELYNQGQAEKKARGPKINKVFFTE